MAEIVLSTLNARYSHASFALRYLYANLPEGLRARAQIAEYTISDDPSDLAEKLLALKPRILGLGVYIWNSRQTLELVRILKKIRPDLVIILGGPEVTYETEEQEICRLADCVVQGEGDLIFGELCAAALAGKPLPRTVKPDLPEVKGLASPYPYYSDADIQHRVVYVEASRGCPYKCEYCLSSLDTSVRNFDLEHFLSEMDGLIARGLRQFKFVDRTFNLSPTISTGILRFFLERAHLGLFLHFEMVPDRLPEALRELIQKFPPGALQFEVGIQTWSPEVTRRVSRRQDFSRIRENFEFLTRQTTVHLHADLIAGLPGEDLESFARGFDSVAALGGHEIQVGILKRLRGAPIARHTEEFGMVYSDQAPYEVLRTSVLDFETLQKLKRFAGHWDRIANRGHFGRTVALLRELGATRGSLFGVFWELSQFLHERQPARHSVALEGWVRGLWDFVVERAPEMDREQVRVALIRDYSVDGKRDIPAFLRAHERDRSWAAYLDSPGTPGLLSQATPERQRRHAVTG